MISSTSFEYIIDKNYIYKNPFEEIKELLKENEKIKLVVLPQYVPYGFQLAKELNENGLAIFDEELKIERNFKEGKNKTKIYISIKRKSDTNEFFFGKDHFHKNIFENIKNYLKNHDKVKIVAKTGEVGIAFKVAKELVSQGIAEYDEELKLSRNYKAGKGNTQVFISLRKKPEIKEYAVKKNAESCEIIRDIKELIKKHEKITMNVLPGEVGTAFKAAKKLVDDGLAIYDDELKIKRNFKAEKGKTKIFISLKKKIQVPKPTINVISVKKNSSNDEIIKEAEGLFKKNSKLILEAQTTEVEPAFRIAEELHTKGIATYDDELKIERNYKEGKGKTKALISLKRMDCVKKYIIGKNATNEKIVKDVKELFKEHDKIDLVALTDQIGCAFTAAKVLHDEGIATFDEELKIKRNFKEGKGKTKAFISLKKINI